MYRRTVVIVCLSLASCCCGSETNYAGTKTARAHDTHDAQNCATSFCEVTTDVSQLEGMPTPCTTPNHDTGFCVEIQNCATLLNQLNNTGAWNFLRASRCGPENEDPRYPKVCCGRYGNYKNLLARNPLPKRCGIQNITLPTRIVGGDEAELGEFPWLATIVHKNFLGYKSHGCSGFLIHTKYVLTAAHCIEAEALKPLGPPFEVMLGEHDTEADMDCNSEHTVCSEAPQLIRIKDIVVHPGYDRQSRHHRNDIALIHLRKGVRFSDYVQPICLLEHNDDEALEYWLSGWGQTEYSESSSVKLKVAVPAVSFQQCSETYSRVRVNINRSQVCAGGTYHRDSCTGDSGGPLMLQRNATHWYAAGVVSFGMGCGRRGWPAVYTNVPSFLPWVKDEILKRAQLPRVRNPTKH